MKSDELTMHTAIPITYIFTTTDIRDERLLHQYGIYNEEQSVIGANGSCTGLKRRRSIRYQYSEGRKEICGIY